MKRALKSKAMKDVYRVVAKPLSPEEQRQYEADSARYAQMTTADLLKEFKPMSPAQRARWDRAKKAGRPRKKASEKAERVLFTIEPELLKKADRYAKAHGLSRSELLTQGIRRVISAA